MFCSESTSSDPVQTKNGFQTDQTFTYIYIYIYFNELYTPNSTKNSNYIFIHTSFVFI